MNDHHNNGTCQHHLIGTSEEIRLVQERVVARMEDRSYHRQDIFGVQLALEEALTNAVRHGNGDDPAKRVRVSHRVEDHQVWIEIEDEGDGFHLDTVRDPTAPENIDRPGGRGLLFIRSYMSSVRFNEVGNRLTMEKQRSNLAN